MQKNIINIDIDIFSSNFLKNIIYYTNDTPHQYGFYEV